MRKAQSISVQSTDRKIEREREEEENENELRWYNINGRICYHYSKIVDINTPISNWKKINKRKRKEKMGRQINSDGVDRNIETKLKSTINTLVKAEQGDIGVYRTNSTENKPEQTTTR